MSTPYCGFCGKVKQVVKNCPHDHRMECPVHKPVFPTIAGGIIIGRAEPKKED